MGFSDFFKPFEQTWKDSWTWKHFTDGMSGALNNAKGAGKSLVFGGLWNTALAITPFSSKFADGSFDDHVKNAVNGYLDFGKNMMGAGANAVAGVAGLPVLSGVLGEIATLQNEVVKRPLGTAFLAAGDALRGGPSLFDGDTWRKAYNDTRTASTGQAVIWGGMGLSAEKGWDEIGGQYDPRTEAGQNYYHNDTEGKWSSGTIDFIADLFDPTIGGAKVAKLAYLNKVTKVMDGSAIRKGAVADYLISDRSGRVFDDIRRDPNTDRVAQQYFNSNPRGYSIAKALTEAAKIEDLNVSRQVYDATLEYGWGNKDALLTIAQKAPRLAAVLGSDSDTAIGHLARNYGQGDPNVDALVQARAKTKVQALVDDLANGTHQDAGYYGPAYRSLLGQAQPRKALTSQWRYGVHTWVNDGGPVSIFALHLDSLPGVQRFGRYALPSSKTTALINLDGPGVTSVENVRANWESAKVLKSDDIAKYVEAYALARSPTERYAAYEAGENAVFAAVADKYHFTPEQAQEAIGRINVMRQNNRVALSQSHAYMSAQAKELSQSLWDEAAYDEAARVRELGSANEAAVRNGLQPNGHFSHVDPDGNLIIIPDKFDVGGTPISPTQTVDVTAAMDWRLLHQELRWAKRGPIGEKAYTVIDHSQALLDAVSSAWKIAQLMRPAFAPRMLSDDLSRVAVMMGAAATVQGAVGGLKNMAINTWNRAGRSRWEEHQANRMTRGMDANDVVDDAAEVESVKASTGLAESRPSVEVRPKTNEELAAAVRRRHARNPDLLTPEARAIVEKHAAAGTDSTTELAAYIGATGVPKGLTGQARVTKRERKVTQHYSDLGKAVADGTFAPQHYVGAAISAYEHRPASITHDMASIIRQHKDLGTDPSRDLIEHALTQQGRAMFANPDWKQGFLDELTGVRLTDRGVENVGPGLREVVVDPFSGDAYSKMPTLASLGNVQKLQPGHELEHLEQFVHDNADELLKPQSVMHAQVMPDGTVELAVAKVDGKNVIKPTGGRRIELKDGRVFDYRQNGAGGLQFKLPGGDLTIDHAFDGAEGARLLNQVSSRGEGQLSWADQVVEKRYVELMHKTRGMWRDNVTFADPHYGTAWERAINNQLANDPVFRQILNGQSDEQIVAWMRKPKAGQEYLSQLAGPWQGKYWAQIGSLRRMAHLYVPGFDQGTEATNALRNAVLNRSAKFEDHLKPLVGDPSDLPMVHGNAIEAATMSGTWSRLTRDFVDGAFKIIGDIPADRLARFPFAANRYDLHTNQLRDAVLATYEKRGLNTIPTDEIEKLQVMARERTVADVRKYLYDAVAQHDLAKVSRLIVPFGSAAFDSFTKWGRIVKEKPWTVVNLWKAWTAPDRVGATTDDQGNVRQFVNGAPRWVQHNPITGEDTVLPKEYKPNQQYVTLQLASDILPGWLGGQVDGVKMVPRLNKASFNTFLGLPTAGPIVAVPVNAFAINNPEFAENKFVKTFILPMGSQRNVGNMVVPGWMRTAYNYATQGDSGDLAETQARSIWQTEMVQYRLGQRNQPPTIVEARDKAAKMVGLRFLYQMTWSSPTFTSPYQPFIDYYRQLRAADPKNADAIFYQEAGSEYFALTASASRNNAGVPSTIGGYKGFEQHKDLIAKHPELAGLIVGRDGGAFSQAAYNWQLQQPIEPGSNKTLREKISLKDSVEDVAIREGWLKYNKLMNAVDAELLNRGLTSIQQKGAEDLAASKKQFTDQLMFYAGPEGVKTINPWYVDFMSVNGAKTTARLQGMQQVIQDPRLQQRDDIRGLTQYLTGRLQMQQMMKADGIKSLQGARAQSYRAQWDAFVMGLRDSNLAFSDVYHRFLSGDQYLDAPM